MRQELDGNVSNAGIINQVINGLLHLRQRLG
jgi:hypothetical protein